MPWFPRSMRNALAMLGLGAGAFLSFTAPTPAQSPPPAQSLPPAPTAASPLALVPAQPPVAPAPVNAPPASADDGCKSAWLTNPRVQITPNAGFFAVPPTGPGYYSLCDWLTGNCLDKAPKFGYPRFGLMATPFFDTDWRYVDQPGYDPDFFERLHRIHLGNNWMFATGGEFRYRSFDEVNSRLSGKSNDYDLTRLRVFGDLWYKDVFRVYVEFISAQSFNQSLPPLVTDREYAGLQNAFVDVKFFEDGDGVPWYVRAGRQELLLGSQRLVSTLDWANTRRTFDGVRAFRHSDTLDIDAWWTRVVIPNQGGAPTPKTSTPTGFASSDPQQNFAGTFMEYRPNKNQAIDLYWMYLDNNNQYNLKTKTPAPIGELATAPYTVHTLGGRWSGKLNANPNVLFDTENMLQLGNSGFNKANIVAGSTSEGIGYNFSKLPMNPTFWAYYDYASGSATLGSGQMSTFNQLYPFGHYYFGTIDYIGRDNIQDVNFHVYLYPTNWVTLNAQYHILNLASATDALYNAGGQILRYDPTGKAGRDVGHELSFIANFHLTKRQDILVAYAHLIEGSFLRSTGAGPVAESLWLMYNIRW